MPRRSPRLDAYLEVGATRVFAGAVDWPGWARSGRDESSALEALVGSGPRLARVLRGTRLGFTAPADARVVERLKGGPSTDFGAPEASPRSDATPMKDADLRRSVAILRASWRAFDRAAEHAGGRELTKGPRGGGRDLHGIVEHVLGADQGYLSMIGWKLDRADRDDLEPVRAAVLDALTRAAREGVPPGPRGGKRWTPRFYVRRAAWHVLDHAWEIEDRSQDPT
ncbi:MAG: hypothetical protein ACRDHU_05995 [Actinomycetota bacterium]